MRIGKYMLMAALAVGLVGASYAEDKGKEEPKGPTIKDVMKKCHSAPKGEDPLCKKFLTGAATEAEIKTILACYAALPGGKPPRGEADSWKTKSTALVSAAKDLAAKKEGAADAYKKAVDCKACHEAHKPLPKPKDK